jgi:hypothetical protein
VIEQKENKGLLLSKPVMGITKVRTTAFSHIVKREPTKGGRRTSKYGMEFSTSPSLQKEGHEQEDDHAPKAF